MVLVNSFIVAWDSTFLDMQEKSNIINLSNLLVSKRMRPSPHFTDFIATLMAFINYDVREGFLDTWIEGVTALASQPSVQLNRITLIIKNTGLLITDRIIFQSPTATWKITSDRYNFINDTVVRVNIAETDLVCYSQNDSTIIFKTSGT